MLTSTYPMLTSMMMSICLMLTEHVPDMGGWLAIWTHVDAVGDATVCRTTYA